MKKAVTRLIGTVVLGVLAAGISMGGMTGDNAKTRTASRDARGANGIQELLDFIYQCHGCARDREQRFDSSNFSWRGGAYHALIMELASAANSTRDIWIATSPAGSGQSNANSGGGPARRAWSYRDPAQTIAYLGGIPDRFVSSSSSAFRKGNRGHGRGSQNFGNKHDTLAAVPEPAPIFLLGTILLATFSIARLRFNR